MRKGEGSPNGEKFNTLAQSGTDNINSHSMQAENIVCNWGTDMNDKAALKGKAKRKTVSQSMSLRLIEAAEKKGNQERVKSYRNTYYCQNNLYSASGRISGQYCKNRFCTVCCSNRKAEIINKYQPEISTWEDPHFVTLTVKSVSAQKLDWILKGIKRAFRQIREKYKKKSQRGTGIKLMGIKSLECNFNPVRRTYNPHLHIIVPNAEIAEILINEWLEKWKSKFTTPKAQFKRRVDSVRRDLVETIKYGAKVFTEPDIKNKGNWQIAPKIYAAALDNIFSALKPYRLFERFGFNIPAKSAPLKRNTMPLDDLENWVFNPALHDWYNTETGELLTGYKPTGRLQFLLNDNFDTELE